MKNAKNAKRQGCLNACGGQKGCRDTWCVDHGEQRKQCYANARKAFDACESACRNGAPKCKDEKCIGFLMIATCDGQSKVTGWCASGTWKF